MIRKPTISLTAVAILIGLAAGTTAFAQNSAPSSPPAQAQGMTGDHGGMMNMMGQTTSDQMKQMAGMIENCNRMMESMTTAPNQPGKERAPDTKG
jgi:hypothetical protein